MIYLILAIIIAFAYVAWRHLPWAVSALVFLLPTYLIRFQVSFVPMTLLEALILTLFVVWLIKRFTEHRHEQVVFSNYKWLMLAWLVFSAVAVYLSPNKVEALGIWKAYFVEPILFFLVFVNTIKTKKDWERIFVALGLSALIISAFAIIQKFTGIFIPNEFWRAEETRRVTSFYGYPNAVGLFLAPIVILFVGKLWLIGDKLIEKSLSLKKNWLSIVFYLLIIISSSLAIIFAQSEGAIVAIGFGLLFLGLVFKRLRLVTLIVLLVSMLSIIFVPVLQTFITEKAFLRDFSGQVRQIMWQEAWQMLKNSPLTGEGIAGYQTAIAPYHHSFRIYEIYLYPHQIILTLWSELGLFGLLTFVWLMIKFFANYFRVKDFDNKKFYLVLMAGMVTILIHGLVDVPYFKNDLSVFVWLMLGLGVVLIKNKEIISE